MIASLKPYAAMRDSGLPWLGKVPVGWEIRRNGRLFAQRIETGFPDLPILEVSLRTGVRVRDFDASASKQVLADRAKYKRAADGDIAYNMMRMWQGAVGVVPMDGLISPAYVVARPFPRTVPGYFAYLYRTDGYMGEVDNYSRGIVKDRNRLYWEQFKQIPTPYPPPAEQAAIVRFLDHADRRIRRYIRAKQKLIKLLEEQKQAIIHRAVTRGLDPNVRLKPSGVEWLGDVPEHWEVAHLRYLVRCLDGRRVPLNAIERGAMQGGYPYWGANKIIDHVDRWLFDEPLVLLGEDGAPFFERGRDVAFAVSGKIWVNNHAHVLRCGTRIVPEFCAHALNCVDYTGFIDGSTRDKLTQQAMGSIPIQVPAIPEQSDIVESLASATSALRTAIARAVQEIGLLREYRTRLIADVVTGKLDVREAAARLPEETERPEPLDEIEAKGDTDEAGADDTDEVPEEAEA